MAKIIRLTESDLTRIVKRVIEEQQTPPTKNFKQMANTLYKAMKGIGTDENSIIGVMNQIQNSNDWNSLLQAFGNREGENLEQWLGGDLSRSEWNQIMGPLYKRVKKYSFK